MLTLCPANIPGPRDFTMNRQQLLSSWSLHSGVCVCVWNKVNKYKYFIWCIRDKYKFDERERMGESLIEGTVFEKKNNLEVGESVSQMGIWRKRICAEGISGAKTMRGKHVCPSRNAGNAGISSLGHAQWEWEWWERNQRSNRKLDHVGPCRI